MQFTHALRALPVALCGVVSLRAQGGYRVAKDGEWFYGSPAGKRLARVAAGAVVDGATTQGDWIQVTLQGWIYGASLGPTSRDSFTLAVAKDPEENLRAQPSGAGAKVARLTNGFGVTQVGEQGTGKSRWVQVRRQGWMRKDALVAVTQVASSTSGPAAVAPAGGGGGGGGADSSSGTRKAAQHPPPLPQPPAGPPPDPTRLRPVRATTVYRAPPPEGAEAGTIDTTTAVRVLSRSGDWTRVQIEGWVKAADLEQAPPGVQIGVTAAELRADPARYAGAVLRWPLQVIAIQSADDLRPDIPSGTPYLLTRGPLPEHGFVYVMFTEAQRAAVTALGPLATIQATVRVRAAKSHFIGTPIVELVSLEVQP
jgi:hypothetical protein